RVRAEGPSGRHSQGSLRPALHQCHGRVREWESARVKEWETSRVASPGLPHGAHVSGSALLTLSLILRRAPGGRHRAAGETYHFGLAGLNGYDDGQQSHANVL